MEADRIAVYFGRVLRDGLPNRDYREKGGFRFAVRLFATSDGHSLLSSADGRVFVRVSRTRAAAVLPIMPALGQFVLIRGGIRSWQNDEGQKILFSQVTADKIRILTDLPANQNSQLLAEPSDPSLRPGTEAFFSGANAYVSRARKQNSALSITGAILPAASLPTFLSAWHRNWPGISQSIWRRRSELRRRLFGSLNELFPPSGRDLFQALLFGQSGELPQQVKDHFRRSGAMHILALSGFHVGILASIVSFLLRRKPLNLGLRRSLLCSSIILLLYLWLVGPLPSLTRAVLMFLLLNGCRFFLRPGNGLAIWSASALLQTRLFPASALSLSFQLSYAALLGLILFAGRCNSLALLLHHRLCGLCRSLRNLCAALPHLHWLHCARPDPIAIRQILRRPGLALSAWLTTALKLSSRFLLQGSSVTIAVLLCSAPILIANFGQLQWIGLPASLVETPLITLYMWLSLALWPLAGLLQSIGQDAILDLLQTGYRQLYYFTLAPMEFFAQASPWLFARTGNSAGRAIELLRGPLLLYLLLNATILALLYRYELRHLAGRFRAIGKGGNNGRERREDYTVKEIHMVSTTARRDTVQNLYHEPGSQSCCR